MKKYHLSIIIVLLFYCFCATSYAQESNNSTKNEQEQNIVSENSQNAQPQTIKNTAPQTLSQTEESTENEVSAKNPAKDEPQNEIPPQRIMPAIEETNLYEQQTPNTETVTNDDESHAILDDFDSDLNLDNTPEQEKESTPFFDLSRLTIGSYGRVQPSLNPKNGKSGRQIHLVYPKPRTNEKAFAEFYVAYQLIKADDSEPQLNLFTSLSANDNLFHYSGDFSSTFAIRNLYLQADNIFTKGTRIWAGSKVYRGDDIFLLDYWPLHNLNTYGAGIGYTATSETAIDLHFGLNRLSKDQYQYQVTDVIDERFIGKREVVFLDRQKMITSLKVEQLLNKNNEELPTIKIKLYGEYHALPKGEKIHKNPESYETLPSDWGLLAGLQLGLSSFLNDSYMNLFFTYASGLAAYGEHAIPFAVNEKKKAEDAKSFQISLSSLIETKSLSTYIGANIRYFKDADNIDEDYDDGWDAAWAIRLVPTFYKYFSPTVEVSQQIRRPNGLNPVNQKQELASVFAFSILPTFTFSEKSTQYPKFIFNYTVSSLNKAAQRTFPLKDELRTSGTIHFIGFSAHWLFNTF